MNTLPHITPSSWLFTVWSLDARGMYAKVIGTVNASDYHKAVQLARDKYQRNDITVIR